MNLIQTRNILFGIFTGAAFMSIALPAMAIQTTLNYVSTYTNSGVPAQASITLTAMESPNGGYYTITGITGEVNGAAITSLLPFNTLGNDNALDQQLELTPPLGVAFTTDSINAEWDLYAFQLNPTYKGYYLYNMPISQTDPYEASSTTEQIGTTQIPLQVPYGTNIPTLGSVLALGAIRKVRKFKVVCKLFQKV